MFAIKMTNRFHVMIIIAALLLLLLYGMMSGWTSPYLAQLTAEDSPLPINLAEASWVASLFSLGRLLGAIPGAMSVYFFGSKKALLFTTFPMIVGWVSLATVNSVVALYVGRFACGISQGMAFSCFPLYLGEISSPEIRGALMSFALNGTSLGVLAGTLIGAYVPMTVFAYSSLVPTAICVIIFLCVPESPYYFVHTDDIQEAKKSIARYNPGIDAEAEVKSLENFIKASQSVTFADKLREFNIPQNRKAGFIVVMLYFFLQFSGANSLTFYMEMILIDGRLTIIRPDTMVIIASAAGLVTSLCTVYLADKLGRKPMMIISSAGVATSMAMLGGHFALLERNYDFYGQQWLLISSIFFYEIFVYAGLVSIPSIICGELFAPNIKSIAACFGSISQGLFSFISTKSYQPLLNIIDEAYVFWFYGVVIAIAIVFTLTIMPETKGKSLQEIQNILHKKKNTTL